MYKNDDVITWFGCLGIILFAIAAVFFGAVASGWVLSIVWIWFVVPLFPMVPVLTIPQAIGFSLVTGMLTGSGSQTETKERTTGEAIVNLLAVAFGRPLMILVIAYIIKAFL